ncbi:hypothetical protein ACQ33O_04000 [Ferruginibacter sp. SUN002]|uniref:hypothetical protein n=1 Tax=Ferruginibacter sp. SUN002 TaxID=2937789 RepID=UPI003D368BBC
MNFFRIVFELFALYLLYKLIFDFIIPVTKTTKAVKKQFGDMQSQMQEKMNQFNKQEQTQQANKKTASTPKSDDYIEFEEIK